MLRTGAAAVATLAVGTIVYLAVSAELERRRADDARGRAEELVSYMHEREVAAFARPCSWAGSNCSA